MISICVPVYEMKGKGVVYLTHLIESIKSQTYKDYEVIISDHSTSNIIEKLCDDYKFVKYIKNKNKVGSSSANINNAIKNAQGSIIKPMFQDDFFYSIDALEKISKSNSNWGAVGFNHLNDSNNIHRPMTPYYQDKIIDGINTIGAPSTIFFRSKIYFDENLLWLMDCELYYRLYQDCGKPEILKDTLVTIRVGSHTISDNMTEDRKLQEESYVKGKHNV